MPQTIFSHENAQSGPSPVQELGERRFEVRPYSALFLVSAFSAGILLLLAVVLLVVGRASGDFWLAAGWGAFMSLTSWSMRQSLHIHDRGLVHRALGRETVIRYQDVKTVRYAYIRGYPFPFDYFVPVLLRSCDITLTDHQGRQFPFVSIRGPNEAFEFVIEQAKKAGASVQE